MASVVNEEVQVQEAHTVYTPQTVYDKSTVMREQTIQVGKTPILEGQMPCSYLSAAGYLFSRARHF